MVVQRAKGFFLVRAGVFLLALAYHFGATSVRAQSNAGIAGVSIDHAGSRRFS